LCKFFSDSLLGISGQSYNFALAQFKVTRVLKMTENGGSGILQSFGN
jgi:hypothetical protein